MVAANFCYEFVLPNEFRDGNICSQGCHLDDGAEDELLPSVVMSLTCETIRVHNSSFVNILFQRGS